MKKLAIIITLSFFTFGNLFAQGNTFEPEYDDLYFSKKDRAKEKEAYQKTINQFSEPDDITQPSLSKFSNPDYDGNGSGENDLASGYYDENAALNAYQESGYNQYYSNSNKSNSFWNRPQWFLSFNTFGGWSMGYGGTGFFQVGLGNNAFNTSNGWNNPWSFPGFYDPYLNCYGYNSFYRPGMSWRSAYRIRSATTLESFSNPSVYRGARYSRNSLASTNRYSNGRSSDTRTFASTKYASRINKRTNSTAMTRFTNGRSANYSGTKRGYLGTTRRSFSNTRSGRSNVSFSGRSSATRRSSSSFIRPSISRSSISRSSSSRSSSSRSSSSSVRRRR